MNCQYYLRNIYNYLNDNYYIRNYVIKPVGKVLWYIFENIMILRHKLRSKKLKYIVKGIYSYREGIKKKENDMVWKEGFERIEVNYRLENYDYKIVFTDNNIVFPPYTSVEIENYNKVKFKNLLLAALTDSGKDYTEELNKLSGPLNNFYKDKGLRMQVRWFLENKNDRIKIVDSELNERYLLWNDNL